jgi:AcrR family transcriptional regulator
MGERLLAVLDGGLAARERDWSFVPIDTRADAGADKGEAARHAFLGAAAEMINEHGYRGASVNKISARLNVSKGAFYHYHDAKNDLVQACFEETARIMRAAQTAAENQSQDALTSLASLAAHLVGGQVSGQIRLLRTSALSAVPKELRPQMMQGMDRITARLSSIVSDGAADGSVRAIDSQIGAQVLSGAINAASELHHWAPGVTAEQAVELYVRPMFMGLFEAR